VARHQKGTVFPQRDLPPFVQQKIADHVENIAFRFASDGVNLREPGLRTAVRRLVSYFPLSKDPREMKSVINAIEQEMGIVRGGFFLARFLFVRERLLETVDKAFRNRYQLFLSRNK